MIYIMAAGNSKRWKTYRPDHLELEKLQVDVYGKPLLLWTIEQLLLRNKPFCLVTKDVVGETKSICHSIDSIRPWIGTCTFLCGDVLWADTDLDYVLSFNGTLGYQFFGSDYEIFAFSCHASVRQWIRAGVNFTWKRSRGRLCDLRRLLNFGNFLDVTEPFSRRNDPNFVFTETWTRDIDHYLAYTNFMQNEGAKEELMNRK